jgi:hypothetical protein
MKPDVRCVQDRLNRFLHNRVHVRLVWSRTAGPKTAQVNASEIAIDN